MYHGKLREPGWDKHRTLDMDMSVNKAGQDILITLNLAGTNLPDFPVAHHNRSPENGLCNHINDVPLDFK
jgi:hypothetical protein